MNETKKNLRMPDIMESIFDIGYLSFALIAGILFLIHANGRKEFLLYGILTLVLCSGDAFHLVPRVKRALMGTSPAIQKQLGIGLQVSSITMTIFYVLLLYVWKALFPEFDAPVILEILIWASAVVRIAVCLLPQNNWISGGNMKLSHLRNGVFAITGLGVLILFLLSGNAHDYRLTRMAAAIAISFACYFPVTLWSYKKPMIGMLMIPKTCAYIWMISMGLQILF